MWIENGILKNVLDSDIVDGKFIIPESITSIGDLAFEECRSLTAIKIPESVTSIGNSAFSNCNSLTEIEIPENVTRIGDRAFWRCRSLTAIKIPESVTSIGNAVFSGCSSLTEIKIPESVASIGNSAFRNCNSLIEIKIPESVTSIGYFAFESCSSLTKIKIPESVTSIKDDVFYGCSSLTKIDLPEKINDKVLEKLYKQMLYIENFDTNCKTELTIRMFGEDIERFERLKRKANFHLGEEYDEKMMDIFYHRMIKSIGIDEVEKIVEIPNLTQEEIREYSLEKDETFKELYETKYQIKGDLGITLQVLKNLRFDKGKAQEKNTIEIKVFKELNRILDEESEKYTTIKQLLSDSIKRAGYEIEEKDITKIEELERKINGKLINENLSRISNQIEQALGDNENGEAIVPAQVKPVRIMIEEAIIEMFKAQGQIEIEELEERINEKLGEARAEYIIQNREQIAKKIYNLFNQEEIRKTISHSAIEALKNTREKIGGVWKYKLNKALETIGYNFDNIPENLTQEQIEQINKAINKGKAEEEQIQIQTTAISKLREGKSREEVYNLLKEKDIPKIVTYKQIHDMFGTVHGPYSEEFKEFFKKHREEFLENTEYIVEFGGIHNNFERIINSTELRNVYQKGKLQIEDILGYLKTLEYENIRERRRRISKIIEISRANSNRRRICTRTKNI